MFLRKVQFEFDTFKAGGLCGLSDDINKRTSALEANDFNVSHDPCQWLLLV